MIPRHRLETVIPLVVLGAMMVATMPVEVAPIDGGELSAVAQGLGVAHPTGYPLWTVVARLVALVPVGASLPWRLGVFSCAAALAALALVAPIIAAALGAAGSGRGRAVVVGAVLVLGGSMPVFLEVARGPEVYALSLLGLGLVLRVAWEAARRGAALGPAIALCAYLLGLGSGVHMTLVLVAPALVFAAWRARPHAATWALALAFAILGRTIYAYLPIRSACQPALDWGNPETWRALNAHAFAWQYRVWMLESGDALLKNLWLFARESWSAFSVSLVLAPLGIARLSRPDRGMLAASTLMFVAFLGYSLAYSIHDIALYFLPAQLVLLYWVAAGAGQILAWIEGRSRARRGARGPSGAAAGAGAAASPSRVLLPAALALVALLLVPAALSWRANAGLARREAHAAESYARSLLESLPPRAIVLSRNWDILVSPSIYLQSVVALRRDVTVVDQEHFRRSWYAPLLARMLPGNAGAAERETAEFLRLLAPFEAGGVFDRDALQAAYERMIHAFLNADPSRPIFATSDIEPAVLRGYAAEPFGLAVRLLRAGEARGSLYRGELPACDTAHLPRAGEWERFAASVAGDNALGNAEYALALGDTALARGRLADAARFGRADAPQAARLRAALGG